MRKYITIPYEDYIKRQNKTTEKDRLTDNVLMSDGSTDAATYHTGQEDDHHSLSNGRAFEVSASRPHLQPPSVPHHQSNSSLDHHRDSDPLHKNHHNSHPHKYSHPSVSSPIETTADTPLPVQNNSHPDPKDPIYSPNPSLVESVRVVSPTKPSSIELGRGKKRKKKGHTVPVDSSHNLSEKSASQDVEEQGKNPGMSHVHPSYHDTQQNEGLAQNFHVLGNEYPTKDPKHTRGEKPKVDHPFSEECSSSSSPQASLLQTDHSEHDINHDGKIYHSSHPSEHDFDSSSSPEVVVNSSQDDSNRMHQQGLVPHRTENHHPVTYEGSMSSGPPSSLSSVNSSKNDGWAGLWNMKNSGRVSSSLSRKDVTGDGNREEEMHSYLKPGYQKSLVNEPPQGMSSEMRGSFLEQDVEKLPQQQQRPLPPHTPLGKVEQSPTVEPTQHPVRHFLPPPGVPVSSNKKQMFSQNISIPQTETHDVIHTIPHDIGTKIHKESTVSHPSILRHNTRPKRSNAGVKPDKWKLGWTS